MIITWKIWAVIGQRFAVIDHWEAVICSAVYIKETSEHVCFYFMKKASQNACCFSGLTSFGGCVHMQYCCDVTRKKTPNNRYLPGLIKRRSNIQEKSMSCERALSLNQWKTFPENHMAICLQIYLELLSLATFIQIHSEEEEVTQKRYPSSLDKILTWKLLFISC